MPQLGGRRGGNNECCRGHHLLLHLQRRRDASNERDIVLCASWQHGAHDWCVPSTVLCSRFIYPLCFLTSRGPCECVPPVYRRLATGSSRSGDRCHIGELQDGQLKMDVDGARSIGLQLSLVGDANVGCNRLLCACWVSKQGNPWI